MELGELEQEYRDREDVIESRLEEFRQLREADDSRLFKELAFVILTSRSSAEQSWEAVEKLDELSLLENGGEDEIADVLQKFGIEYEQNKARYIVKNREKLSQPTLENPSGELKLRRRIDPDDLERTREKLVDEIKGISWKGASHFLRNIGCGDDFAIVSVYITRELKKLGMLDSAGPPRNEAEYRKIEEKVRQLSEETGIGMQELDLLLWSMETGEVFK